MRFIPFGWMVVVLTLSGCGSTPHQPREMDGPGLRVMTYNVNYGSSPIDSAGIIERANVDVICLQETTPEWERFARSRFTGQYPYILFRHEPAAGGMGVLSRFPIDPLFYDRPDDGWFHGWGLRGQTYLGDVQFLNVHLRPSLSESGAVTVSAYFQAKQVRKDEMVYLSSQLAAEIPTIVLGDFNENDDGRAIEYAARHGFTDALRQYDRHTNTWRWPTSVVTLKGRYDHILYSQHLNCLGARVITAGSSDHLPVVAVLGLKQPGE